jgi:hypothetical protein
MNKKNILHQNNIKYAKVIKTSNLHFTNFTKFSIKKGKKEVVENLYLDISKNFSKKSVKF